MQTEIVQAATTFILRPATPADVPALHRLIEASVRGLQTADYTPGQIEAAVGRTLGLDTQLIADRTYFVACPAEDPATLAACGGWSFRTTLCGGDRIAGRSATQLDPATGAARIRAIYVHPAFARRGLGTLVLAHCEQAARSAGFRIFEMGSTLTGVPLYTLRGYRETGRIALPLPGELELPVVLMRKEVA